MLLVVLCFFVGRGDGFSLMVALKLYYMSHVKPSTVPSICGEGRAEQNRQWSQGTTSERGEGSNGEMSLLEEDDRSPKVLASVFTLVENSQFSLLGPFLSKEMHSFVGLK